MADYNLGRAHGVIEIENRGDGFRQTQQGFDRTNQAANRSNRGFQRYIRLLRDITAAMTVFGPAAGVMSATVIAAVGGIAAAFLSAGAAVGAFGIAVAGQLKQVKENSEAAKKLSDAEIDYANKSQVAAELAAKGHRLKGKAESAATSAQLKMIQAQKAWDNQTKGLPKETRDTALAFARLKTSYESWSNSLAGETMPIFTRSLNLLRTILPQLTPLVRVASEVLGDFVGQAERSVKGGGFERMAVRLAAFARGDLPALLNSIKNVAVGLGGIFSAFLPASNEASNNIAELTERFANWGQGLEDSPGFQGFMDNMREVGPQASAALGDLLQTVVNLVVAFGPFLGISLQITTAMLDFMASVPTEVLTVLLGVVTALAIGIRVYNIALRIARVATLAWGAATWVLNAAFWASPITWIIVGIVALVAVIILIATKTTWFQTAWEYTWNFIKAVTSAVVGWIVDFVRNHWRILISLMLGPLGIIISLVTKYWDQIKNAFSTAIGWVVNFVRDHWRIIISLLTGPLGVAIALITKYWDDITGTVSKAASLWWSAVRWVVDKVIRGFQLWMKLPTTVANIFNGMLKAMIDRFNRMLQIAAGVPGSIGRIFRNAGTWLYNAGRNIITGLINGVISALKGLWNIFKSITNRIPQIKGPMRVDLQLLTPNGKAIMMSLMRGVSSQIPALESMLGDIGTKVIPASVTASQTTTAMNTLVSASDRAGKPMTASEFVTAMKRAGVGEVYLDGEPIHRNVSLRSGREASLSRRVRPSGI